MLPAKIYLDANLLVLLVVGETDKKMIAKHRRSKAFDVNDYERLVGLINQIDQVLVTPNTLTETSNLLSQHGQPERSRLFEVLRLLIEEREEIVVTSKAASRNNEFIRLGLTDAALLEVVSAESPLITVDFDLYGAALAKGAGAMSYGKRNFNRPTRPDRGLLSRSRSGTSAAVQFFREMIGTLSVDTG